MRSKFLPRIESRGRRGAAGRSVLMVLAAASLIGFGLHATGRINFASSPPAEAKVGSPAPDFELEEVSSGEMIRLSKLRDKPVILNFWCGCGLCRPVAVLWSEVKERVPDVHMVAVIGDHSAYNPVFVKDFKWGTGWEHPVLADIGTTVGLSYHSVDCPRVWVIDRSGIIRHSNTDRMDSPTTIVDGALAAAADLLQD